MISVFLSITVIMTGIGLGFVLPAMFGRGGRVAFDRGRLNAAIYRERISELERQHRDKSIDDAEFARFGDEIRQSALSDLERNDLEGGMSAATRTDRLTPVLVAIAVPVVAFGLYFHLGTLLPLLDTPGPGASRKMAHSSSDASSRQPSVEEMVARLASRLEEDPDNPKGWLMLGRSYMMLGRFDDAKASFGAAFERWPENPEVLVNYAGSLARDNEGSMEGKPLELIRTALRIEPNFPSALWLAGIAAYEQEEYADAIGYWKALQKKGGIDEEQQQVLTESLSKAREMMGPKGDTD
uniref:Cytochrome c-type biogenesis protein CcmI n=1 Tax=Candidatus Kentrum sp. SD TaxID=2126332 RepID=A0A451BLT0_9GAMM|nr:MAG: cytochrome c-type biogenesis protein CcmI [Candidatus Kentron sp. SD]